MALETKDIAVKDTDAVAGNLLQAVSGGGYEDSGINANSISTDIYGLEWNRDTNTFTRIYSAVGLSGGSDFDSIEPWASMQRCNVADAGTVNDYYGDVGFEYDGSNGEVMVEVAPFYYHTSRTDTGAIFLLSYRDQPGFTKHPAFVRNGNHLDYIYPSAFEGYYDSGYMRSIANVVPSTSDGVSDGSLSPIAAYPATTAGAEGLDSNGGDIRNCRYWAQQRGIQWEQHDFLTHNALCYLAFIEYGTFDLQTAIGKGVVDKASGSNNNAELTGQTAGYAGGTDLGNASGQISTNGLKSMSYRGVENLYGNIWIWVDGLNIKANHDPYYAEYGFESDKFDDHYIHLNTTLPSSNGYGGDIILNENIDFGFLIGALGGASNSGLYDYYYQDTGNRIARVGGSWSLGLIAGPLIWSLLYSSAIAYRAIGSRSLCLPLPYSRT